MPNYVTHEGRELKSMKKNLRQFFVITHILFMNNKKNTPVNK